MSAVQARTEAGGTGAFVFLSVPPFHLTWAFLNVLRPAVAIDGHRAHRIVDDNVYGWIAYPFFCGRQ